MKQDKEKPIKPIVYCGPDYINYYCSACEKKCNGSMIKQMVGYKADNENYTHKFGSYCQNCGQHINWSGIE